MVTTEIFRQIFWSVNKSTFWSWGVSMILPGEYKNMPTLMLHVNGFLHKGWVYVSLNEAKDNYEVRLLSDNLKETYYIDEVYCDTLGKTIDEIVEREKTTTDEEYKAMVENSLKE